MLKETASQIRMRDSDSIGLASIAGVGGFTVYNL